MSYPFGAHQLCRAASGPGFLVCPGLVAMSDPRLASVSFESDTPSVSDASDHDGSLHASSVESSPVDLMDAGGSSAESSGAFSVAPSTEVLWNLLGSRCPCSTLVGHSSFPDSEPIVLPRRSNRSHWGRTFQRLEVADSFRDEVSDAAILDDDAGEVDESIHYETSFGSAVEPVLDVALRARLFGRGAALSVQVTLVLRTLVRALSALVQQC